MKDRRPVALAREDWKGGDPRARKERSRTNNQEQIDITQMFGALASKRQPRHPEVRRRHLHGAKHIKPMFVDALVAFGTLTAERLDCERKVDIPHVESGLRAIRHSTS